MDWLGVVCIAAYFAGIGACGVVISRLVTGRWNPATARQAGQALVPGALVYGLALSSAATPDWSPFTMFALWLPYLGIAAWALFYSRYISRGLDRAGSARKALLWALPLLLLVPSSIASLMSAFPLG